MRGVGGPLLCIGDLLSDVGEGDGWDRPNLGAQFESHSSPSSPSSSSAVPNSNLNLHPSDLAKHFQENYELLNEALTGTDHSWTSLTLKLCTALETASKLVQSTNSHVGMLSERVGELEKIIKRQDSAIAAAKAIHSSLNRKEGSLIGQKRPDRLQG